MMMPQSQSGEDRSATVSWYWLLLLDRSHIGPEAFSCQFQRFRTSAPTKAQERKILEGLKILHLPAALAKSQIGVTIAEIFGTYPVLYWRAVPFLRVDVDALSVGVEIPDFAGANPNVHSRANYT